MSQSVVDLDMDQETKTQRFGLWLAPVTMTPRLVRVCVKWSSWNRFWQRTKALIGPGSSLQTWFSSVLVSCWFQGEKYDEMSHVTKQINIRGLLPPAAHSVQDWVKKTLRSQFFKLQPLQRVTSCLWLMPCQWDDKHSDVITWAQLVIRQPPATLLQDSSGPHQQVLGSQCVSVWHKPTHTTSVHSVSKYFVKKCKQILTAQTLEQRVD